MQFIKILLLLILTTFPFGAPKRGAVKNSSKNKRERKKKRNEIQFFEENNKTNTIPLLDNDANSWNSFYDFGTK